MTDEEIFLHIKKKYPQYKNHPKSLEEKFPLEVNENNRFEEIMFSLMSDFVRKKLKR